MRSEENTDDSTDEEERKKLLADWAIRKQIPHSALNELLPRSIPIPIPRKYLSLGYL